MNIVCFANIPMEDHYATIDTTIPALTLASIQLNILQLSSDQTSNRIIKKVLVQLLEIIFVRFEYAVWKLLNLQFEPLQMFLSLTNSCLALQFLVEVPLQ